MFELKNSLNKVDLYDESELCSSKIRVIHGTNTPNGKAIEWYPNGTTKVITNYVSGSRHGKYKEYYPDGSIKAKVMFKNNKAVEINRWDESGNQIQ